MDSLGFGRGAAVAEGPVVLLFFAAEAPPPKIAEHIPRMTSHDRSTQLQFIKGASPAAVQPVLSLIALHASLPLQKPCWEMTSTARGVIRQNKSKKRHGGMQVREWATRTILSFHASAATPPKKARRRSRGVRRGIMDGRESNSVQMLRDRQR